MQQVPERQVAQSSKSHYNQMNVLSMHALIGAYKEEDSEGLMSCVWSWVTALIMPAPYGKQLQGNQVFKPQGTYMLYIDCGMAKSWMTWMSCIRQVPMQV